MDCVSTFFSIAMAAFFFNISGLIAGVVVVVVALIATAVVVVIIVIVICSRNKSKFIYTL